VGAKMQSVVTQKRNYLLLKKKRRRENYLFTDPMIFARLTYSMCDSASVSRPYEEIIALIFFLLLALIKAEKNVFLSNMLLLLKLVANICEFYL
jgi:hypothetical protein